MKSGNHQEIGKVLLPAECFILKDKLKFLSLFHLKEANLILFIVLLDVTTFYLD